MGRDERQLKDERTQRLVEAGWDAFYARRARWMRTIVARLKGIAKDTPELLDLQWRQLYLEGDMAAALQVAQRGAELFPEDPDLLYAVGWCLLELGSPEEAIPLLRRTCRMEPSMADAWYDLGIAMEQRGDEQGMLEAFTKVHELDTARLEEPPLFAVEEFERIAADALAELPEPLQDAMSDVAVILEEYPENWILEAPPYDPRLFGLFVGPTWAETRGSSSQLIDEPTRIHVFQRNLERQFQHPLDLAMEIRVTVIHEVGHYLGLNEQELAERGWL